MLFSSDCSAGTGRVIEPPGDARVNVPQDADGGCVEVGAALARARGHAGRGARGRSSGPARDGHAGLPVGPFVTERGDPGPGGPVPGAPDPPLGTARYWQVILILKAQNGVFGAAEHSTDGNGTHLL